MIGKANSFDALTMGTTVDSSTIAEVGISYTP